jgi:16S rRNA (cytosine967-C5)-methyltransferase
MTNPRVLTVTALHKIRKEGAYANILTNEMLSQNNLVRLDAAMFTDLVHGTTRYRRYLDYLIEICASRPIAEIEDQLVNILEFSFYSYLIRAKPQHAVVNEGVETAREIIGERSVGFINAILRNVVSKSKSDWDHEISNQLSGIDLLGTIYSMPNWIVEYFQKQVSNERELIVLLQSLNLSPVPTFLRPPNQRVNELNLIPGNWSPFGYFESKRGDLQRKLLESRLVIQDEGSQLVALALISAEIVGSDNNWLDMTAGPGGKAAFLAAAAPSRNATLVANELHPHRAKLIENTLQRLDLRADVQVGDALNQAWSAQFDRVLLDAPCTGLGALRRRAESRWRKTPADLIELVDLQKKLLSKAVRAARSGGIVGYTTCSLHPRETEEVVNFIAKTHRVQILNAPMYLPGIPMEDSPFIKLWPHRHGTDGMFMALLQVG